LPFFFGISRDINSGISFITLETVVFGKFLITSEGSNRSWDRVASAIDSSLIEGIINY
jgi:hypothetical protein